MRSGSFWLWDGPRFGGGRLRFQRSVSGFPVAVEVFLGHRDYPADRFVGENHLDWVNDFDGGGIAFLDHFALLRLVALATAYKSVPLTRASRATPCFAPLARPQAGDVAKGFTSPVAWLRRRRDQIRSPLRQG